MSLFYVACKKREKDCILKCEVLVNFLNTETDLLSIVH